MFGEFERAMAGISSYETSITREPSTSHIKPNKVGPIDQNKQSGENTTRGNRRQKRRRNRGKNFNDRFNLI